jgi:hypothetical protein
LYTISVFPIEFIEIEPGNFHLFIYVKIGRKKARLLLDTGASKTAFDSNKILEYAHAHSSEPTEMHSVGLGSSQVHTQLKDLGSIKFGEIKLSKIEVAVLDLSHVNSAYKMLGLPEIVGVLGSDILVNLKAILNLGKMEIKLKQKV